MNSEKMCFGEREEAGRERGKWGWRGPGRRMGGGEGGKNTTRSEKDEMVPSARSLPFL